MLVPEANAPQRSKLDIVQDCSDLRGTFPSNVELHFVYWEHGDDYGTKAAENGKLLAPYCLDADVIAMEVALTLQPTLRDVQKEYDIINEAVQESVNRLNNPQLLAVPKKDPEELYGSLPMSTAWNNCLGIYNGILKLKNGNLEKAPVFMPFDVMEYDPDDGGFIRTTLKLEEWPGFAGFVTRVAEVNRQREAVVLRQLQAMSQELAADGEDHKIAITYGKVHTPTSVAARELGANVSRSFIGSTKIGAMDYAFRLIRYADNSDDQRKKIKAAEYQGILGMEIAERAQQLGMVNKDDDIKDRLFTLIMRAEEEALPKSRFDKYDRALTVLAPFISEQIEKIPRRQKKAYRNAVQSLVELSLKN